MADKIEKAVFAAGCFWCVQPFFDQTEGVVSARVGYTGGKMTNPTYEDVCTGLTGHREAIKVVYDPAKVRFEKLLEIFWETIDPTDAGGQFFDRGPQYMTAIYYFNEVQRKAAEASKEAVAKRVGKPIVTEILPGQEFYPAEDYHQAFYKKSPGRYEQYKIGSGREEKLKKIWGEPKDGVH